MLSREVLRECTDCLLASLPFSGSGVVVDVRAALSVHACRFVNNGDEVFGVTRTESDACVRDAANF